MARKTLTQQLAEAQATIAARDEQLLACKTEIDRLEEERRAYRAANRAQIEEMYQEQDRVLRDQEEHHGRDLEAITAEHRVEMAKLEGAASMARQIIGDLTKNQKPAAGLPPGLMTLMGMMSHPHFGGDFGPEDFGG